MLQYLQFVSRANRALSDSDGEAKPYYRYNQIMYNEPEGILSLFSTKILKEI